MPGADAPTTDNQSVPARTPGPGSPPPTILPVHPPGLDIDTPEVSDGELHGGPPTRRSWADGPTMPRWLAVITERHLGFYLLMFLLACGVPLAAHNGRALAIGLAALIMWTVSYATLGAPAARTDKTGAIMAYFGIVTIAVAGTMAVLPAGVILVAVAFAHMWSICRSLWLGTLWTCVLTLAGIVGYLVRVDFEPVQPVANIAMLLACGSFSLASGVWATRAVHQSEERSRILDELAHARGELAAIHHHDGVIAERERMAREIHDTLAQGFLSIVTLARSAQADLAQADLAPSTRPRPDTTQTVSEDTEPLHPSGTQPVARALDLIESIAQDNLDEARQLVAAFSRRQAPDVERAIRRLADRCRDETGIVVDVDWSAEAGDMPRATAIILLRTVQEALTNIRRHSQASAATVIVEQVQDEIELTISDDGVGIPDHVTPGFGLAGMRTRIEMSGGSLTVASGHGDGTTISAIIPIGTQESEI